TLRDRVGGKELERVELRADGTSPKRSGAHGFFSMDFPPPKKPGNEVHLSVKMDPLVVVHEIMLTQVLRAEPTDFQAKILLCDPGDCCEMARMYFGLPPVQVIQK